MDILTIKRMEKGFVVVYADQQGKGDHVKVLVSKEALVQHILSWVRKADANPAAAR